MRRTLLVLGIALAIVYATAYVTTPKMRGGLAPDPKPVALVQSAGAESARVAATERLRAGALDLERKYRDLDFVRDMRGEHRVTVGPAFFRVDYQLKQQACTAVAQARAALGLPPDYFLHEPMNNRRIGYFSGARLEME